MMNNAKLFSTLRRMACIINDRPIGVRALDDEVVPVTPNMLLLRKTSSAPDLSNSYDASVERFTERLGYIMQV